MAKFVELENLSTQPVRPISLNVDLIAAIQPHLNMDNELDDKTIITMSAGTTFSVAGQYSTVLNLIKA